MMIFQPLITNEQTNICLDFEKKFKVLRVEEMNKFKVLRVEGFAGWRNEKFTVLRVENWKKKMKYFYVCMNFLKSPMKLITCIWNIFSNTFIIGLILCKSLFQSIILRKKYKWYQYITQGRTKSKVHGILIFLKPTLNGVYMIFMQFILLSF